jgi:hypothetical protein
MTSIDPAGGVSGRLRVMGAGAQGQDRAALVAGSAGQVVPVGREAQVAAGACLAPAVPVALVGSVAPGDCWS